MRIGLDVGGTHTDAVLMDGSQVIARVKATTTEDVASGIEAALASVLEGQSPAAVDLLTIGTTQFTNAGGGAKATLARCRGPRVLTGRSGAHASCRLAPGSHRGYRWR